MELINIQRFTKAQDNNKEHLQNVDNGVINWNWCLEKIFDNLRKQKSILQLIAENYEISYYRIYKEHFPALLNEAQEFLKTYNDDKEEINNTIKFFSDAINDDVDFVQFKLDLYNHGDFLTSKFNYTTA